MMLEQRSCLVVWDLQDMVLHAVSEVDKVQKGIVAIAGSLCKDQWLFYASEGSHSIKVRAHQSLPRAVQKPTH